MAMEEAFGFQPQPNVTNIPETKPRDRILDHLIFAWGFIDANDSFPDVLFDVCFQATRLTRRRVTPNQLSSPDIRTCICRKKGRDMRREIRKAAIT
jgi:hypothetical protein